MHFLYIIFISLVNNLDNVVVPITYSIRGIKISLQKNILISLITFIISFFAASMGSIISKQFDKHISAYLSMVLFIGIGLWIIIDSYIKKNRKSENPVIIETSKNIFTICDSPECADMDNSKEIDFKEATFLGIALSLNNIGGGLSAGMIGLSSFYVGLLSAVINFLALLAGNSLTKWFTRFNLGNKATFISGIILILIGILQVV